MGLETLSIYRKEKEKCLVLLSVKITLKYFWSLQIAQNNSLKMHDLLCLYLMAFQW